MKKICKFVMLLSIMLLSVSQMAWADSGVFMPDFAKASAKVSTKSSGKGSVYIYSQQSIDWPMACVMLGGSDCGYTGNPEDISLENAVQSPREEDVTADMAENSVINKEIVGMYDLVGGIGTAPTICAKFMAFPANGYYLKGWSKTDNDFDLGSGTLEQCILTEARAVPIFKNAGAITGGEISPEDLEGVNIPDPSEYPDFGTYYATFAPVLINACTAGKKAYIKAGESYDTQANFELTFSTTYADNAFDFAAPKLMYVDAGGVKHYADEEGKLSVPGWGTFTLDLGSEIDLYIDGNVESYDCFKTFAEQGVTEPLYSKSVCDSRKGESVEQLLCNDQYPILGKQYFTRCHDIAYDIEVSIDYEWVVLASNKTFSEQGYDKIYSEMWYDDLSKSSADYLCASDYPEEHDYFTQCHYFYNTAYSSTKINVDLKYHVKSPDGWKEIVRNTSLHSDKTFAEQGFTELYTSPYHYGDPSIYMYNLSTTKPESGYSYYLNCYNAYESGNIETEPELPTELEPIEGSLVNGVFFDHNEKFANLYINFELEDTSDENHTQLVPGSELKLYVTLASAGGESSLTEPISLIVEEGSENEVLLSFGEGEAVGMSLMQAVGYLLSPEAPMDAEPTIKLMQPAVVSPLQIAEDVYISAVFARNCTIDLNGYEITNDGDLPAMFIVCNNATLTIEDSKGDGRIVLSREASSSEVNEHVFSVACGYPGATELAAAAGMILSSDNGHVVLNGGEIRGEQYDTPNMEYSYGAGAVVVMPTSTFTMNGGKVTAISDMQNACGVANMGGAVTINGGTIAADAKVSTASAVWNMVGNLHINGGSLSATSLYGSVGVMMGVMPGMEAPVESDENGLYPIYATADIKKATISATATNSVDFNSDYLAAGIMLTDGTSITLTEKPAISGTMPNSENLATAIALFDGRIGLNINGAKLSASNSTGNILEFLPIGGLDNVALNVDAIYTVDHEILDNCLLYLKEMDEAYDTNFASMYKVYNVGAGKEFIEGYRYFFGTTDAATMLPVCKIGTNAFTTLEDAFLYAQNNPSVTTPIVMLKDYTLPAGYYTLPANATLLVPYAASQSQPMRGNVIKLPFEPNNGGYEHPYPYCKLTLASGVHIDAHGSIEASCKQFINGRADQGDAVPTGAYGWIYMEEGSEILLGDGAHLYAWGFVTGKGTIDARRGSYVHEDFQVYDWPGATDALNVVLGAFSSGAGTFPVNQYAMQNVESQITFRPGSRMYASFGASAAFEGSGIQIAADAIQIVGVDGDVAMFLLDDKADADNTWVRKHYDAENDQQVWEVNSAAHLGSMNIEIPAFQMASFILGDIRGFDTRNFVLPITSNMKLHLLSGYMDITQNTEFLPGAEMEVDKTALLTIFNTDNDPSDGRVIFMDDDDWKDGYGCVTPYHEIRYSPTFDATLGSTLGDGNGRPNVRNLTREEGSDKKEVGDAKLNVHGTFDVNGYLLTSAGGATIFSNNEDAGTINYTTAVSEIATINEVMVGYNRDGFPLDENIATLTYNMRFWCDWDRGNERIRDFADRTLYVRHNNKESEYTGASSEEIDLYPASLKNNVKTPEFAETGSDSDPVLEGESYCFVSNRWTKMTQYDQRFVYNNYGDWYIKPSEYVAIATQSKDESGDYADATTTTQPLENADHTYSDAAGEGRLFIWVGPSSDGTPGQWWEVTLEDNLYKGKNGIYYYCQDDYDGDSDEHTYTWVEKTFEIKFLNWDGNPIMDANGNELEYTLHYGDAVFYNSTNPTRENTVDYTYTFNGWTPEITADSKVTGDATYTAQFTETKRKYTITFLNENGTEIERHFLTRDEMPVCEDVPTKAGNYLQWEPTISAVVGDQEYRATFLPEPPTEFTVTFLNNDGSEIATYENVAKRTKVNTIFNQAEPAKAEVDGSEYTWTFTGWMPAIDDEMEVEDNMTFIAQYDKAKKTCNVIFKDENGEVLKAATAYEYGQVPVAPEYTKSATPQYTYIVTWPGLQAVTLQQIQAGEDIIYQAVIDSTKNKYMVTINATGCAASGAGIYDHGTEVTLSLVVLNGYKNPMWSDGTTEDKTITITGDVTYSASAVIDEENEQYLAIDLSGSADDVELDKVTKVTSFNVVAGEGVSTPQLFGAAYIEMLKGAKAYFTYSFGTAEKPAEKLNWYAFAVPFKCDAQTATSANGSILRNTHEYDIVEYDGAIRAAQGPVDACWKYVSGILYPGKLYMIIFNKDQTTITFTGKDNGTYYYDNVASVEEYPLNGGDSNGNGWNGIANPALYRATLATGAENAEEYVNGVYRPVDLSDALAIAKPVFVQATVTQPVVVEAPSSAPVAARRTAAATTDRYVLNFGQDRVFLVNDEMAEDKYVTGQDLAKFGVSTKAAQIWVNRYGTQLCVNHQASEWGETTYPLGVFAPKADSYTFRIDNANNGKQIWLLEDGIPVWNFAYGDYISDMAKGTTNSYSICIRQTPSISTPVENTEATTGIAEKVLINGVLYIIRDNATYNAAGEKIK